MTRVYAVREDTSARVLVEIECDECGCDATIKPNREIAESGWRKRGFRYGPTVDDISESDYCPEHARRAD